MCCMQTSKEKMQRGVQTRRLFSG
ncbi:hypothetical protein Pint_02371 [Pistacia integerrima]|uniref:Uncharacterized protein n=1 Tax=Pistacia integerrima TaxID=434235 RepID=A0ACC0ZFH3_9ROSI|nr:hypothetical protein Pint_02371 [Pistacia integerrima]